jgi:transcriptional regulator with XRE-family HTH domain
MSNPSAFGLNLQALRRQRGLTQAALSERSGVPTMVISHYETGVKQYANVPNLCKLADALGATTDALVTPRAG